MLLALIAAPNFAHATKCTFEADPASVKVNWTAYKTTQKVAVGGSFTEVTIDFHNQKAKALRDILNATSAKIQGNAKMLTTGNPGRDQTLWDHFFSKFKRASNIFKNGGEIAGKISNVKGSDEAGDFTIDVKMNDKSVAVPMHYALDKDGHFEATGGLDLLDFALDAPLAELNKNCEVLHKGADGVSKTWSTVDLKLNATIAQKCDS